jgi:hypothetical protein
LGGRRGTRPGTLLSHQGPTFLIEYDNKQNNANHVHFVFRDFTDDLGEDLLKKQYEQAHAAADK